MARATEHRLLLWKSITTIMQGWALSEQGHSADAVARIQEGLAMLAATGDQLFRPYYLAMLAEALGKAGRGGEWLSALGGAMASYREFKVPYWDVELRRLRGELLLARNGSDAAGAEGCFLRAMEAAQAQSAKSLELRAATSLARLWRDQGKRAQARDRPDAETTPGDWVLRWCQSSCTDKYPHTAGGARIRCQSR